MNTTDFTNLDFFQSRQQLIEFLSTKTEFQDFNFDGPAISVLLDAMTFVLNQMALTANMSISEVFLDSALIRSSVISRAKEIGYSPSSENSSFVSVDVTYNSVDGDEDIIVERGTVLSTWDGQNANSFVSIKDQTLIKSGNSWSGTIEFNEGYLTKQRFSASNPEFMISNKYVDLNALTVTHILPDTTRVEYDRYNGELVMVDGESKIFFVDETPEGFYVIKFGDNIIGAKPNGGTIEIEYLVTHGSRGNSSILSASIATPLTKIVAGNPVVVPGNNFNVVSDKYSMGGSERESIESIKKYAPLSNEAQDRTVTKNDYIAAVHKQYAGLVESVKVWGGEENTPPVYGSVIVAIKPYGYRYLPKLKKEEIADFLKRKSVLNITPIIADPVYMDLKITSKIFGRNTNDLNAAIPGIQNNIKNLIANINKEEKTTFKLNDFFNIVSGPNVEYSDVVIELVKIVPKTSLSFTFNNEIRASSVYTPTFLTSANTTLYLKDDGSGNIDAIYSSGNLFRKNIGTVNYATGVVDIRNFSLDSNINDIQFFAKPNKNFINTNNALVDTLSSTIEVVRI